MREIKQLADLAALWTLGIALIIGEVVVLAMTKGKVDSQTFGMVVGSFAAALPTVITSIRNIRQSQAMQSMVEALGNSTPVTNPVPPEEGK